MPSLFKTVPTGSKFYHTACSFATLYPRTLSSSSLFKMAGAFNVSGDDSGNPKNVGSPVIFDAVKKPKRNKYAFGCAILASMTSVLLGYGIRPSSNFPLIINACVFFSTIT